MKTPNVAAAVRCLPILWACLGLCGCDKPAPTPALPTSVVTPQPEAEPSKATAAPTQADAGDLPLAEAKSIMAQRCTLCHGLDGRGNGPAAANLNPKPANYTDPKWQASVDDDTLRKAIVGGGPAVGKSMMMPANPDLKDKPQVVDALVKLIRGFKK